MDLMKLQNLLNECIMIEQGNYLGGNFSVDLAEAQAELDHAKQLLIPRVSGWLWLATTTPPLENKKYTVLDKYGNQEENVLFGCSGFMNEPYSFFEGKKVKAKDIIAYR